MKTRKLGSKLLLLILPLCLLLSLSWAFAAAESGSISITLTDSADLPVSGIMVSLFCVADPHGALSSDFATANISADELLDSRNNAALSAQLVQYIHANGLIGEEQTTDSNGFILYDDLARGVYLVLCKDCQELSFTPFLAYIPTVVGEFVLYDIQSAPKAEVPGGAEDHLYKVSYSYSGDVPADAPPCPEDAWYEVGTTVLVVQEPQIDGYHFMWTYNPSELSATALESLSAQGRGSFGIVKLGAFRLTSASRVELTADSFTMPANDVHIIGVFTTEDPQPTPSPDPTESPEPSQTSDDPKLPQTGVNKLPVCLLIGAGGIFLFAGIVDLCRNRRKSDE